MIRCVLVTEFLLVTTGARADTGPPSPLARPVVAVSGGAEGFITPELRDVVRDGGVWSARVSAGARKEVRIELAYMGSAQPLDAMQGSMLLGTGLVGTLRINVAPWVSTVEPFFVFGGGWSRFQVRNRRATASLIATDDVLDIPIGFGAARAFGRYVLDVRAALTVTAGADLLPIARDPSTSRDSAVMHRFGVTASLGFEI